MTNDDKNRALKELFESLQEKCGSDKSRRLDMKASDEDDDDIMDAEVTIYKNGTMMENVKGDAVCSAVLREEDGGVYILAGGHMCPNDVINMMQALIYSVENDILLNMSEWEEDDE